MTRPPGAARTTNTTRSIDFSGRETRHEEREQHADLGLADHLDDEIGGELD